MSQFRSLINSKKNEIKNKDDVENPDALCDELFLFTKEKLLYLLKFRQNYLVSKDINSINYEMKNKYQDKTQKLLDTKLNEYMPFLNNINFEIPEDKEDNSELLKICGNILKFIDEINKEEFEKIKEIHNQRIILCKNKIESLKGITNLVKEIKSDINLFDILKLLKTSFCNNDNEDIQYFNRYHYNNNTCGIPSDYLLDLRNEFYTLFTELINILKENINKSDILPYIILNTLTLDYDEEDVIILNYNGFLNMLLDYSVINDKDKEKYYDIFEYWYINSLPSPSQIISSTLNDTIFRKEIKINKNIISIYCHKLLMLITSKLLCNKNLLYNKNKDPELLSDEIDESVNQNIKEIEKILNMIIKFNFNSYFIEEINKLYLQSKLIDNNIINISSR